jgi:catalase
MPLATDEKLLTLSHDIIEGFDNIQGSDPAHAKGILPTGLLSPSPEAASLTRAPHIQRNSTPVTVRFSDFAGIPTVPDNDPQGASPRGCAIRFHLAEHVHTDIVAPSTYQSFMGSRKPGIHVEGLPDAGGLAVLAGLVASRPSRHRRGC